MNDVLHDPAVKDALDPKLWSFLKVLYTDNRGMNLRNLIAHGVAPAGAFNRIHAALVVQSVVFLTMIREEAMYVTKDQTADPPPAHMPAEEKIDDAGDVPEKNEESYTRMPASPAI
jgi:hypothetical protein